MSVLAKLGLFLAMQYPVEVPGVTVSIYVPLKHLLTVKLLLFVNVNREVKKRSQAFGTWMKLCST